MAQIDIIRSCKRSDKTIRFKSVFNPSAIRFDPFWDMEKCNVCTTWLLFHDHEKLMFTPEKSYPASKLNHTLKLKPKIITRDHLESCIEDVYVALQTKKWKVTTCKSFLKTEGFNQKCIDDIIDYALNNISYISAKQNAHNDSSCISIIG